MPTLKFHPQGKSIEVHAGANLMASIIRANVPIGSSCGASGICAKCVITVLSGIENLSKPNTTEQKLIQREKLEPNIRVSCQTKILSGEVTITASYW